MILAGDFRKGVTFVYNNGVYVLLSIVVYAANTP